MKKLSYLINNVERVHAKPAAALAFLCCGFTCDVTVECKGKTAKGNNVLQILKLGARKGDTLNISALGEDEEVAILQIEKLLNHELIEKIDYDSLDENDFRRL